MKRLPQYHILLWTEKIHDPVDIILKVNEFLRRYGERYCPVIYDDQKIEMEQNILENFVAKHRASNDDGVFHTLLKTANGLQFNLTTNNVKKLRLPEILSIGFDTHHFGGDENTFTFERLYQLFVFCIKLFEPFWGEIGDGEQAMSLQDIRLKVDTKKIPRAIFWFSYFDEAMVERLGGRKKVLAAPAYLVEPLQQTNGYIVILQRELFDYHNPEHRQRQKSMEDYFGLRGLQKLYPKPKKEWWRTA